MFAVNGLLLPDLIEGYRRLEGRKKMLLRVWKNLFLHRIQLPKMKVVFKHMDNCELTYVHSECHPSQIFYTFIHNPTGFPYLGNRAQLRWFLNAVGKTFSLIAEENVFSKSLCWCVCV